MRLLLSLGFATVAMLVAWSVHASVVAAPAALYFGEVAVGEWGKNISVHITNTQSEISSVSVSDTCNARDFTVNHACATLQPGETCAVEVNFAPQAEGLTDCTVQLSTSTQNQIVYVQGTGVGAD